MLAVVRCLHSEGLHSSAFHFTSDPCSIREKGEGGGRYEED